MPPKRASFLSWGDDPQCSEIRKFLQDAGIVLDVRDVQKNPLTVSEIDRMIGFVPIEYFLNPNSKTFVENNIDPDRLDRDEAIKLIAADPTLLRRPIIRTNRLFTVGCDRKKICEMLQISPNGRSTQDEEKENGSHQPATPSK